MTTESKTYGNGTLEEWKFYRDSGWTRHEAKVALAPYEAIADLIAENEELKKRIAELGWAEEEANKAREFFSKDW